MICDKESLSLRKIQILGRTSRAQIGTNPVIVKQRIVNWTISSFKAHFVMNRSPTSSKISDMDSIAAACTQTQGNTQKADVDMTKILSNLKENRTNYTHRMIKRNIVKFMCKTRHLIRKISPKNNISKE